MSFSRHESVEETVNRIRTLDPGKPVAFNAVEHLSDIEEMRRFFSAFVIYTEKHERIPEGEALERVKRQISSALEHQEEAIIAQWNEVMRSTAIMPPQLPIRRPTASLHEHLPSIRRHRHPPRQ